MIKSEINKCIIKNRLWKIIVLFIILKVCSVCIQQYDFDEVIENNKDRYFNTLEWSKGKLDSIQEEKINSYYNDIIKKVQERGELQQLHQNNDIDSDEYKKKYLKLTHELENRDAFNLVFQQYIRAKENPDKIWIIYENGWNAFWSSATPDILLIIALIIFNVLVIGEDYENEMDCILRTSYMGRKKLFISRLLLSFVISAVIVTLFSLIEIGYIQIRFGIGDLAAPVQSVSCLADSNFSGNLLEALSGVIFFRLTGVLILVVIVHMITYLTKRNLVSILLSLSIIYVPYLLQTMESSIYHLPMPIGMLVGKGYFYGTKSEKNDEIAKVSFQSVGEKELLIIMISAAVLSIIFVAISFYLYSGRRFRLKKISYIIILICVVQLLGCEKQNDIVYNSISDATEYSNGEVSVVLDTNIYMIDDRAVKKSILHNPFFDEERIEYIRCIYGEGNDIYFLYNKDSIEIYKISLENLSDEYVYKFDYNNKTNINYSAGELVDWSAACKFWIDKNILYVLTGTSVRKIDMVTNISRMVATDVVGDFSYYHGILYYINSDDQLMESKLDGSEPLETGIYANACWIEAGKVFYTDLFNGNNNTL